MPDRPPFPPRVAQPPGKTHLKFSPDGRRMLVAGCGNYARSFRTHDNGEPDMINDTHDDTLAVACGNDYVILGCEDGTVCEYAVPSSELKEMLVRSTLPIRDIALSPNEEWIAVSSDEIEVKIVNRHDNERIHVLRNHPKPIKHLAYDPSGKLLAASCTDGKIYIYQTDSEEPKLLRTIDGIIQRLETNQEVTSKCFWHPNGGVFACATASRDLAIVSVEDGSIRQTFSGGHEGQVTSMAWSPNGALLVSAAMDDRLVIWNTNSRSILESFNFEKILNVEWHNQGDNLLCWTNSWGEAYIIPGILKNQEHVNLLKAPATNFDPSVDRKRQQTNGIEPRRPLVNGRPRADTPDSLEELLGPDPDAAEDEYDWIEDDDGAGYKNSNGKRPNGHLDELNGSYSKRSRQSLWQPQKHESFQPGATPWRGNRKYLCLNLIGFAWTVDQDTHNTVTVEFYDREMYRDYHFTDPFQYDKACLNENGALFSCPPNNDQPAMIFYRPHETWTNRADFRVSLPDGEDVSCIALSNRYVVACTTANYVRVWTLFGTPVKVWRMKNTPAVTCAAHGDFVMTVGNGSVGADGFTQLVYSIDDIRHDETCQSEDIIALGSVLLNDVEESVNLKNIFWSDNGDPCIYDSNGVCMVLLHWRTPGQAKWVPVLDTKQLDRLKDGKKEESYWPIAVADEKFHCIILKGGDQYPYFPRPLLSEFDLQMPIGRPIEKPEEDDGEETNAAAGRRLEESYVRSTLLLSLLDDFVQSQGDHASHATKTEVARREIEVNKVLLQLLAVECREGEDQGMKALEIVALMKDSGGKMVEAASKVAARWGRTVLEEKIRELGERRLMGMTDD